MLPQSTNTSKLNRFVNERPVNVANGVECLVSIRYVPIFFLHSKKDKLFHAIPSFVCKCMSCKESKSFLNLS